MKKVAVILSGCGYLDGSEIHESICALLAIEQAGASYACFAPEMNQRNVVNHLTGDDMNETRLVLVESARIARGDIKPVGQANVEDFDAVVFPGGFGAALNLSDFAAQGSRCRVEPETLKFAQAMKAAGKPLGFICIAPAMIPVVCGAGVTLTIGNDKGTADAITAMGGKHENCSVDECVIDKANKVVSTPAYMLGPKVSDVFQGISKAVKAVLAMA